MKLFVCTFHSQLNSIQSIFSNTIKMVFISIQKKTKVLQMKSIHTFTKTIEYDRKTCHFVRTNWHFRMKNFQCVIGRAILSSVGWAIENWILDIYFGMKLNEYFFDYFTPLHIFDSFMQKLKWTDENKNGKRIFCLNVKKVEKKLKNDIFAKEIESVTVFAQNVLSSFSFTWINTYVKMTSIFWINLMCTDPIVMHYIVTFLASLNIAFKI